jgi:hypothetical protein
MKSIIFWDMTPCGPLSWVETQRTTRRHIPEDDNLHENFVSVFSYYENKNSKNNKKQLS